MEFVGQGFLLDVQDYQAPDKESGKTVQKYKYSFLTGTEVKDKNGVTYLQDAEVHNSISDKLLLSKVAYLQRIRVAVSIKSTWVKRDGRAVEEKKPTYRVVGDL